MKRTMIGITLLLLIGLTISFAVFFVNPSTIAEAVTITLGVTLYHFAMRLAIGTAIHAIMKNRANHQQAWFREKAFERRLYKLLRVRKWKAYLPTYSPSTFDTSKKTVREIVGASYQAEVVHEVIMAFSLLPIAFIPLLGGAIALIVTSILALLFDSLFVILQRYNRPRLVRVMARFSKLHAEEHAPPRSNDGFGILPDAPK